MFFETRVCVKRNPTFLISPNGETNKSNSANEHRDKISTRRKNRTVLRGARRSGGDGGGDGGGGVLWKIEERRREKRSWIGFFIKFR